MFAKQKEVLIQSSVMWDDVVQEGLDDLPCVDVVLDEGMLSDDQDMHGGLLEQLAMGY